MAKKQEEKISIFGQAKVKTSGTKPKDDKEVVYIDGLEPKLLELEFLKAQIKDLEAQLGGVADEIKNISKEKFVELYKSNNTNPNTFLIKDGEGCVMVIPTDKYISIKDEDRANQLIDEYGDDIISVDEKYYFNPQVLERNMSAIEKLIMDAKTISNEDKKNLLVKEVKYSITKGYIDKLAQYGSKIGTVLDDIQPIITLKNCGGKMEEGGMMGDDFIANVYGEGSMVGKSWTVNFMSDNNSKTKYVNANSESEAIDKGFRLISEDGEDSDEYSVESVYESKEFNYEGGGFLGGIFGGGRTYKKGLAYKLDRAKHNKSEDWEVPMKNRKKRYEDGDMVDEEYEYDEKETDVVKFVVPADNRELQQDLEDFLNFLATKYFEHPTLFEELESEGYDIDDLFNLSIISSPKEFVTSFSVPQYDSFAFSNYDFPDGKNEGDVISEVHKKFGDSVKNVTSYYEGGGFLGGIFGGGRTYKKGLAYKLDRAKHNKSEDWEVPLKNRKKRYEDGDMVDDKYETFYGGVFYTIGYGDDPARLHTYEKSFYVTRFEHDEDLFKDGKSLKGISKGGFETEKEAREYGEKMIDMYLDKYGIDDEYANGGNMYYNGGGIMTDEMCVIQSCVNGEIHCDMLEEIIGSKPNYPYQQVGSIKLEKCYLRPYYKIS